MIAAPVLLFLLAAAPVAGIVADQRSADGTPLVIHNIGAGTQLEDVLFAYKMAGHFRYR